MFSRMLSNVCALVEQSECQQAVRILSDAFPGVDEYRLVSAIVGAGLTLYSQGKLEEAERHYRLAIALYDKCIPSAHSQVLSAISEIIVVMEETGRGADVDNFLRDTQPLSSRAAQALNRPFSAAV